MAVFRVDKTKDYVVMSNYHLRDKNLSLKAKGLLSWMLSNDERWDYTVAGIVAVMKESRDAINSALCELEDYGYLTRQQVRDRGKFSEMEYVITEKPITENPISENPQQINTNINKYKNKNNSLSKDKEEQAPETKKYKNYGEIYTDPINSEIRVALEKFVKSLSKKHGYNPRVTTVSKFADTLRNLSSNNPELSMRIVDQSIDRGWKDLYKLKERHLRDATSVPFNPEKDTLAKDEEGKVLVF